MLTNLALEVLADIFVLAKLHHDVELVAGLERVVELDDVRVFQLVHQEGLSQRLLLLLSTHTTEVNLLKNVHITRLPIYNSIDYTKGALA